MGSLCRLASLTTRLTRVTRLSPAATSSALSGAFFFKEPATPVAVLVFPSLEQACRAVSTTPRLDGKGSALLPSMHWNLERVFSVLSLITIPVAFLLHNPYMDTLMAVVILIHSHWGLESIIRDYLCRKLVMNKPFPVIYGKVALLLLYVWTILSLAACIHFNFTDVGLTKAVRMIWTGL